MDRITPNERLDALRASLEEKMSQKRYFHTLEVEKMAVRLAKLYAPQECDALRAAALLHDLTKEYSREEHLAVFSKYSVELLDADLLAEKTFHARSAAVLIPELYPELASETVISAVRWHTTGRAGMTLAEKLIYLADYIDMSRKFEDCVILRDYFFSASPERMSESERLCHLDKTLVLSFDMTISGLIENGSVISDDTTRARNDLIVALSQKGSGR